MKVDISAEDALLVGHTLRALAQRNPQVCEPLMRVGAALVAAAKPKEPRVRGEKGCL